MSFSAFSQESPVGEFTGHTDVGSPQIAGSASYDDATQEYTLTGAGTNMWVGRDQFQFVWKKMKGDFLLRTRADFVGKGAVEHRKIGWMVRPSLDADAPYADCARHGVDLTSLQFRRSKGAVTEQITLPIKNPDVLQFERRGSNYIFSAAHFGETFVSAELTNFDLGDDAYVGLFICSHTNGLAEKAIFRDVRVIVPVKPNFVPYRDYIGSVMEILDVQSGELQAVHRAKVPFEAPNWTRDNASLIYNVSGRAPGWGSLMRFDLATKTSTMIDTGPAKQNNNDHVLSFDGAMLAISDQSASHGGKSAVFTVPATGGTPVRITPLSPSYLHGWSPDAKFLVFAGQRPVPGQTTNKFDIYKIASDGSGEEMRLTDAPGVNDGPEYTPDGKYIYFNSSRTGRMQLWRMNPDGTGQEQITTDDYNNWFPHISPDGQWIVYISFPPDIEADSHPYYKHVYLRLMPITGGPSKVIAYVYGGQGTMNVPSWSPDSKKIAFVSNTDLP